MKEMELAVVAAFNKMAEDGAIQKVIEEKLAATVSEVVGKVLGRYSDFSKKLEDHVAATLNVDLCELNLVGYNETVLKIIRQQLDDSINTIGRARMEESMKELLSNPPAEITLSQLVEEMKKANEREGYYECTCIVENSNTSFCSDYKRVYLDKEGGKDKRECDIQLAITGSGEVYSFSIRGQDLKTTIFAGPFYGFDRTLFQMYAAKTKLIVDEDEVNRNYPGYED